MVKPNLKSQICREQMTWFLNLFLDIRTTFKLAVHSELTLDVERLYSLSKRTVLEQLTDAIFMEESIEEVAYCFFSEQAQSAIERVEYMELDEIESFFNTSEGLLEAGEFAEVVWALLTDNRAAVVQHGYSLLHATYTAIGALEEDGKRKSGHIHVAEKNPEIDAPTLQHDKEDSQNRQIDEIRRKWDDLKGQHTALQKKYQQLEQHVAFLLEENQRLKSREQIYHIEHKHLKELEQENDILRKKETVYGKTKAMLEQVTSEKQQLLLEKQAGAIQLKESERIKAAKETFEAELTLVEEAFYKGNQGMEELQTSLYEHFNTLQKFQESARNALTQIRDTVTQLDENALEDPNGYYAKASRQPRVGVFVDVQNMFYAAKDRFSRRVDYIKLLDLIVGPRQLMAAYAYVVQIPEINQSSFLSLLEHNGYTIKSKDLRLRGDGSAKGDWDVGIAVDIVSMLGTLDVVVLASGDGDFCPLAELIKQQDKRVEVVALNTIPLWIYNKLLISFFR